MSERGHPEIAFPSEVRISATNFGPIDNCNVDLRPLTVFVGPSNTGKTYFATLVYALHRVLEGFPRLPHHLYGFARNSWQVEPVARADVGEEELKGVLDKLKTEGQAFAFSDLPEGVRSVAHSWLNDPKFIGEEVRTELERCFDLESVADLIRLFENGAKVSLDVGEGRGSWRFQLGIPERGDITMGGGIDDISLLPEGWSASEPVGQESFLLRKLITEIQRLDSSQAPPNQFLEFFDLLWRVAAGGGFSSHYLPAARSGIMQSHRVIARSLVARSTRGGLENFPEIPTFSGVMADFLEWLIMYQERGSSNRCMGELADALERESLAGRIEARVSQAGGYPEFVYFPGEGQQEFRLSRTSSMVSELAPVVLFLRGAVRRGDLLIIEEPEAHLHPAAQTQMAVTLARMVRAGVRVLVTTHSDWLLKEIGNLIREGELGTEGSESLPSSLRPKEVGIWLFRRDGTAEGSTVEEVPFDPSEGVEPPDYEDVAEELYNRSANLQNQLEECRDE